MSKINLFYLSPNNTGGWVTFTAHLIDALEHCGVTGVLRKIGNNSERKDRPFGYGITYRNTSRTEAYNLCANEPCLIVAAAKKFRDETEKMMLAGAKLVVHDPTELKNLPAGLLNMQEQCVVIRRAGLQMLPKARFIRHPYTRMVHTKPDIKMTLCASTSRIDFDKHTEILLDANRLLNEGNKIKIYGFENRLYTKFKIMPNYPEWEQSKVAYPREKSAAVDILRDALFMADMSIIKGDGGGTQYTTLEAWDAGAVPIINEGWAYRDDDMKPGVNCRLVRNGDELAWCLSRYENGGLTDGMRLTMQAEGYRQLLQHSPEIIGLQYAEFMKGA